MLNHSHAEPLLLAPESSLSFASQLAAALGTRLSELVQRIFPDGEFTLRPTESIAGRRVILIQSLARDHFHSVGDKLTELLLLSSTVGKQRPESIILVAPYLCFGRSDRPLGFQGPVLNRTVAELLEAAGIDCVITMDAHNLSAYHNAFRCSSFHVSAAGLFADYMQTHLPSKNPVIVSPDLGGLKRCSTFRDILMEREGFQAELCVASKTRIDHVVEGRIILGSVHGKDAIILDDMISTGSTLSHAVRACAEQGAGRIYVAATHGLFAPGADELLEDLPLEKLVLINSVIPYQLESPRLKERLEILNAAPEFARVIEQF